MTDTFIEVGPNTPTSLDVYTKAEADAKYFLNTTDTFTGDLTFISGTLSSDVAPDVDNGGACFNHGSGDGNVVTFKNSDVNHGITTQAETDTYGELFKSNATTGGLRVNGLSEATIGLHLTSIGTTSETSDTGVGGITLDSAKKSGTTKGSWGAGDNAVTFRNNNTIIVVIKGNGDLVTQASIKISGIASGATQGASGVGAGFLWKTASHATLPDNVVMIGV